MTSSSSPLQPDILTGMPSSIIQPSSFSFKPSTLSTSSSSSGFKLSSSVLSSSSSRISAKTTSVSPDNSSNRKNLSKRMFEDESMQTNQPQRKVFVNEDVVSQHFQDLHITQPRSKVARRSRGGDVMEAAMVEDLENKFSHQASIK